MRNWIFVKVETSEPGLYDGERLHWNGKQYLLFATHKTKKPETKKPERSCIRRDRLRQLRNQIDFRSLFRSLGLPWKRRDDGVVQFVCPLCSESQTSVNPRTNLASAMFSLRSQLESDRLYDANSGD